MPTPVVSSNPINTNYEHVPLQATGRSSGRQVSKTSADKTFHRGVTSNKFPQRKLKKSASATNNPCESKLDSKINKEKFTEAFKNSTFKIPLGLFDEFERLTKNLKDCKSQDDKNMLNIITKGFLASKDCKYNALELITNYYQATGDTTLIKNNLNALSSVLSQIVNDKQEPSLQEQVSQTFIEIFNQPDNLEKMFAKGSDITILTRLSIISTLISMQEITGQKTKVCDLIRPNLFKEAFISLNTYKDQLKKDGFLPGSNVNKYSRLTFSLCNILRSTQVIRPIIPPKEIIAITKALTANINESATVAKGSNFMKPMVEQLLSVRIATLPIHLHNLGHDENIDMLSTLNTDIQSAKLGKDFLTQRWLLITDQKLIETQLSKLAYCTHKTAEINNANQLLNTFCKKHLKNYNIDNNFLLPREFLNINLSKLDRIKIAIAKSTPLQSKEIIKSHLKTLKNLYNRDKHDTLNDGLKNNKKISQSNKIMEQILIEMAHLHFIEETEEGKNKAFKLLNTHCFQHPENEFERAKLFAMKLGDFAKASSALERIKEEMNTENHLEALEPHTISNRLSQCYYRLSNSTSNQQNYAIKCFEEACNTMKTCQNKEQYSGTMINAITTMMKNNLIFNQHSKNLPKSLSKPTITCWQTLLQSIKTL